MSARRNAARLSGLALTLTLGSSCAALASVAGLPSHFGFGLGNGPGEVDWMVDSGAAWDYRYQYLAGDCTGTSWAQWNTPDGAFATLYLDDSAAHGYVPVLTYYLIVPASPGAGSEDYSQKFANAYTMWCYYENWKLLMQKCAEFGGTVIVHVEPDLWAFMQKDHGIYPENCYVAVAASGLSEASGYEDSACGFAQLLVSLRDAIASNVILAWHVSCWATGTDFMVNGGDPALLGSQVAGFYNALGAPYDLLFVDMSDRDSAFYEYQHGDSSRWMDAADFTRFREYMAAICSATGLKAMLWQMPCGNTLYRSCDNTWKHYQDNRAQYFLLPQNRGNVEAYAAAGIIGCLFGPGADGCTSYGDGAGDGVTNPAPVNGNDLAAVHADDDGGFLRTATAGYYSAGPVPVSAATGGGDGSASEGDGGGGCCADGPSPSGAASRCGWLVACALVAGALAAARRVDALTRG